jgi:hypothetical protein
MLLSHDVHAVHALGLLRPELRFILLPVVRFELLPVVRPGLLPVLPGGACRSLRPHRE